MCCHRQLSEVSARASTWIGILETAEDLDPMSDGKEVLDQAQGLSTARLEVVTAMYAILSVRECVRKFDSSAMML